MVRSMYAPEMDRTLGLLKEILDFPTQHTCKLRVKSGRALDPGELSGLLGYIEPVLRSEDLLFKVR